MLVKLTPDGFEGDVQQHDNTIRQPFTKGVEQKKILLRQKMIFLKFEATDWLRIGPLIMLIFCIPQFKDTITDSCSVGVFKTMTTQQGFF